MRRLAVLALGAFLTQTGEYLPISLLPAISQDLDVSQAAVGGLVTVYAWIAALSAAPLTILTLRWDRRTLFVTLLAVIGIANLVAAVSPGYGALAAMRVLMALTHGVFWAILAVLAVRLAPDMPRSRVLAVVFSGTSMAGVLGVPLSTLIGQFFGWRWAFGIFAATTGILVIAGWALLPKTPASPTVKGLLFPRGDNVLYGIVLATALIVAGHFCAYTYILPLLEQVAGISARTAPAFLFVFGATGALGIIAAGWVRQPTSRLAIISAGGVALSQMALIASSASAVTWAAMAIWGASIAMLVIALQEWVIERAPKQTDAASALYVAAFNVGIGSGSGVGGRLIEVAPISAVLWGGACLTFVGLTVLVIAGEARSHLKGGANGP